MGRYVNSFGRVTHESYKARVRRGVGKPLLRESVATDAEVTIRQVWVVRDDAWRMGLFVSCRNAAQSVPGTMRIELKDHPNRRLSLDWTSLGACRHWPPFGLHSVITCAAGSRRRRSPGSLVTMRSCRSLA